MSDRRRVPVEARTGFGAVAASHSARHGSRRRPASQVRRTADIS